MTGGQQPGQARDLRTPPGVLAGAVLRAARLSARAGVEPVAAALDLTVDTYLSLEAGIVVVGKMPIRMLGELKSMLGEAGARPELVADLEVAAWSDLILAAVANGESLACLLADPLATDGRLAELMTWALIGQPPARYRLHVARMPLVRDALLTRRAVDLLRVAWPGPAIPALGVLAST